MSIFPRNMPIGAAKRLSASVKARGSRGRRTSGDGPRRRETAPRGLRRRAGSRPGPPRQRARGPHRGRGGRKAEDLRPQRPLGREAQRLRPRDSRPFQGPADHPAPGHLRRLLRDGRPPRRLRRPRHDLHQRFPRLLPGAPLGGRRREAQADDPRERRGAARTARKPSCRSRRSPPATSCSCRRAPSSPPTCAS